MSLPDLPSRFAAHLAASRLLDGAARILVACSGGGDSSALLVLLERWARPRGVALVAAHVAHGLRGEAGRLDGRAAADLAARFFLPFVLLPVEVRELRKKGESLEAAGRRLRYEALLALARDLGEGTPVATGHTLDDQAETVLLNLARHTGRTRGGIRARRADGVVRPLLPFVRAELRALLERDGFPWREDETNEDERLLRNRIRRRVLPALEAASPGSAARLARAAEAWSRRLESLDEQVDAELAAARAPLAGPFPRSLFGRLGAEAAGRLLVRAVSGPQAAPGRAQVDRVLSRITRGDPRFAELLAGRRVDADERAVRILPPARLKR